MENFIIVLESFIVEKENWRSLFLSVDSIRFLNKYHRKAVVQVLEKYETHVVESTQNLRSSIRKNALMLVKEVF